MGFTQRLNYTSLKWDKHFISFFKYFYMHVFVGKYMKVIACCGLMFHLKNYDVIKQSEKCPVDSPIWGFMRGEYITLGVT